MNAYLQETHWKKTKANEKKQTHKTNEINKTKPVEQTLVQLLYNPIICHWDRILLIFKSFKKVS